MYPVAPLARGHALAVACTSYHGAVFFGVTADRDVFSDVEQFAEHIGEAVAELLPPAPGPVDDVGTARAGRRTDGAGRRRRPPAETERPR
jgi:diacylglycerol O-acyltransferase